MFEKVNYQENEKVLCLKITEGLTDKENDALGQLLERQATKFGKIRLLLIFKGYPRADRAESLYDDLRFAKLFAEKIERMAVVGDKAWQETWIALFGLFGGITTAYFEHSDMDKAKAWLDG